MKTLKNLKKNNKGFTLIEIIIVIVIIAILAAMLIPSMISWIDKANQKTFLSACDSIKTAVSSVATEKYAVSGDKVLSSAEDIASVTELVGEKYTFTIGTVTGATANENTYNIELDADGAVKKIANKKYTGDLTSGNWVVTANAK